MARRAYQLAKRAETAQETRRRLVEAIFALHSSQGIAATTMAQIAKRAGVGIGTVYHHFQSLDETVQACGEMVMATYPPPGEEVLAGAVTIKDRTFRLAQALWPHLERVAFDRVRPDREAAPVVGKFIDMEEAHRIALTAAALAPFKVDRDLVRVVAALLDFDIYRSLQRAGLTLDQAAEEIATVIAARVTHKG